MSGTGPNDEDMIRAGEYALGLLPDDEAEAFLRDMRADAELHAAYLAWVEEFAGLADEVKPEQPPERVRKKIQAELFGTPERRRLFGFGWWSGGLVAALMLVALLFGRDFIGPDVAEPALVAEIAAEDRGLVINASYAEDGALRLERSAGAAREGRALELWFIEGDNAPVSLGVLPETREAELTVPEELRPRMGGAVLAVSDEPPGGSPTGAPTGDVLALGEVSDA